MTKYEQYVIDKQWDYKDTGGNNIAIEYCSFCGGDGYKFFLNTDNGLWDCKKGACNRSGNFNKLRQQNGDPIEKPDTNVTSKETARVVEVEAIKEADIEAQHQALIESHDWVNWLNDSRGWSFDTISKLKLGFAKRNFEGEYKYCLTYPYLVGKQYTFVKYRTLPPAEKDFRATTGRPLPLYNQNAIKKDMPYLCLFEGEGDTVSAIELGEENAVGVPGSTIKNATFTDLLDFPQKLYLIYDNDEAGQKGAKLFAERFGIDKFHNIVLPEFDLSEPVEEHGELRTKGKDFTEWVMEGHTLADLHELMADAKPFDVEGVTGLCQTLAEARKEIKARGTNLPKYTTPWPGVGRIVGGFDDKQLVIVQAQKKSGKTTFAINLGDHFVESAEVDVHFECKEMPRGDLGRKWAAFKTSTDDTIGKQTVGEVEQMFLKAEAIAAKRENEMTFGYSTITSLEAEFDRLKSVIRRYGSKVLIYDNLQFLVDRVHNEKMGGRHSFMSKVTKMFKSLAMDLNILVMLIAQTRGNDDDMLATSNTLEGSSAPGNDCDTMIVLNRTKFLQVKNKDDLRKIGNVETHQELNPELYVNVGLSRFAAGGNYTLMIDGAKSLVYERNPEDEMKRMVDGNSTSIGGMKFIPAVGASEPETEVTI